MAGMDRDKQCASLTPKWYVFLSRPIWGKCLLDSENYLWVFVYYAKKHIISCSYYN